MKFNRSILLASVALFSLTGCNKKVRYEPKEYVVNYSSAANAQPYSDGSFNILQLSDIHFTYLAENEYHYKFIRKTINAAKKALNDEPLHLIVVTGDTFTFATKETIKSACNFFEQQKVPWTITFGNHDEQGYFSVDWMTGYLNHLSKEDHSNLLFVDKQNDDVFGNANFVINLDRDKDNRQIVILDSNRYNYGEGMGYDYIHSDQIDWYKRMYRYFDDKILGEPTSLAFFHIPLPEYTDAYNKALKDKSLFDTSKVYDGDGDGGETVTRDVRGEDESSPLVNSHFMDCIASSNFYTKGIFVGHDHINSYAVNYNYDNKDDPDIKLCYGIKATNTVYYDDAHLGGQIIRFGYNKENPNVGDIQTDLILHKYNDAEVK